ncbi:unnamed protein product [Acanthoscelides obtectus]|uniref:Uncharacterized protein n=1 Tax=Acanthoscelides obtectus TaxID=200917 RepID=A0A9P0PNT7_ACAOB|nr:unnamed protein product [Acanthoscelides obtectus]CAK1640665.1 Protein ZBED8 [Acanthoscelides obtectus]
MQVNVISVNILVDLFAGVVAKPYLYEESLKQVRLDKSGSYHTGVSQHLKASFEVAFMIATQKKPHTSGEELIKPCVLKATQIVLGEDAEKKMKSSRINFIAADIKPQIINKVELSPLPLDESTDIVNCAQLIVYVCYIGGDIIQEEVLYSQSLTGGTTSEDIFNSV